MKSWKVAIGLPLLVATMLLQSAWALNCKPYQEVASQLDKKYGEQLVFSGFADSDAGAGSDAIYEFWGNPKRGNWSLVAQKLFLFRQDDGATFIKNCAFIVKSGKQHHVLKQRALVTEQPAGIDVAVGPATATDPNSITDSAIGSDSDAVSTAPAVPAPEPVNCISHRRHAQALKERYDEEPVVQALTDDKTLVEVYGSESSWTIIQAQVREVRNTLTGSPVTDSQTGQQIHQFCSDPAYSGITWTLSEIVADDFI